MNDVCGIVISLKGICKACPYFDPAIECFDNYTDVDCSNKDSCQRAYSLGLEDSGLEPDMSDEEKEYQKWKEGIEAFYKKMDLPYAFVGDYMIPIGGPGPHLFGYDLRLEYFKDKKMENKNETT